MTITRKEFRRFTKKEMKELIKNYSISDIKVTSKMSKIEIMGVVFRSPMFKAVRSSIKPKAPRKMSEKQKTNLKRFQKVKQQVDKDVIIETPKVIKTSIESEKVQPDFKNEKVIKSKTKYVAEVAKFERIEPKVILPTEQEKTKDRIKEDKKFVKREQQLTDTIRNVQSGEQTLKVQNKQANVSQSGIKSAMEKTLKGVKAQEVPFVSELEQLKIQDPQNPMFLFLELLKARESEKQMAEQGVQAEPIGVQVEPVQPSQPLNPLAPDFQPGQPEVPEVEEVDVENRGTGEELLVPVLPNLVTRISVLALNKIATNNQINVEPNDTKADVAKKIALKIGVDRTEILIRRALQQSRRGRK